MCKENKSTIIDKSEYLEFVNSFIDMTDLVITISKLGDNRIITKDIKIIYSCILYTRLCTFSVSIKILCTSQNHSDYNSIFSLIRNIIDCSHMLYYLCFDDISQQEREFRYLGLALYDLNDRKRLLSLRDKGLGTISDACLFTIVRKNYGLYGVDHLIDIYKERIKSNAYYWLTDINKREKILNGSNHFINTSPEQVDEKMGIINNNCYRALYKVLSSSVHSFPIANENMIFGRIGCGVQTEGERELIAYGLSYCAGYLRFSTMKMIEKIFFEFKDKFNLDEIKKLESILEQVSKKPPEDPEDDI